jgi:hypothetical protein
MIAVSTGAKEPSYFPAQKAVLDDRATDLGARTHRQIAVGKV